MGGDINIQAQTVDIQAADQSSHGHQTQSASKTAIGGSVNIPLVDALKGMASTVNQARQTQGDARMQAMAGLNLAMQGAALVDTAAQAMQGPTLKVGVTLGHQQSKSEGTQTQSHAIGSKVIADGNISIQATGAEKNSNLNVQGSDLNALGRVLLKADNDIKLTASQDTATQSSSNSSGGASIGVAYNMGAQNGFSLELAANRALGRGDGQGVANNNSHVNAKQVVIESGGNTTLKGTVVQAEQVQAKVGGDLKVESLQDSSTFSAKQQSAGINASICIPPFCYGNSSVGGSYSQASSSGNFKSVTEQSGIKTGDGGFQLDVKGATDLKGGAITSSQAAIDQNKNSLTTQNITVSSLQNTDDSKASGFGISGSVSGKLGDQSAAAMADKTPEQQTAAKQKGGTTQGIGVGYTSTSQSSVTSSGISQGSLTLTSGQETPKELDRSVTTDKDTAHALKQAWDGQKNLATVQTQVAITQEFGKLAPKAVGDYAASKMQPITDAQNYQELKKLDGLGQLGTDGKAQLQTLEQKGGLTPEKAAATLADPQAQQDYQNWKEGGAYRVATHTVIGGLTGNASGAIGAGASAAAAPSLNDLQASLQDKLIASGMNAEVASGIAKATTGAMAAGLGAATGGTAGAAAGFNQDLNNRQLHPSELTLAAQLAAKSGGKYSAKQIADAMRASGHSSYGESITEGMLVDPNKPGQIYDAGASFTTYDGKTLVQTAADGKGLNPSQIDANLQAFIRSNTGADNSPYRDLAPATVKSPPNSTTPPGVDNFSHQRVIVNGQSFSLPVTDCPAAACTDSNPIARFSNNPEDQAQIAAFDSALAKQQKKDAVNGALAVGAVALTPATLIGSTIAGGVVGGTSSAAEQQIDKGSIDGQKVAIDAAKGGVAGAVLYGGALVVGKVVGAVDGKAAQAIADAKAVEAQKVENNVGANGGVKIAGDATPGPVNLMGNGDQFFKNAAKRTDIDPNGSFDVIAHGSAQNIEVMTAKGPVTVDQRVAGRLIENSPGYTAGQPVRLLSCDTGACDAGFAQNLANKMGVPVQAPTELVWAYGNGSMVVAPRTSMNPSSPLFNVPDLSRQGTFRTFTPGTKP